MPPPLGDGAENGEASETFGAGPSFGGGSWMVDQVAHGCWMLVVGQILGQKREFRVLKSDVTQTHMFGILIASPRAQMLPAAMMLHGNDEFTRGIHHRFRKLMLRVLPHLKVEPFCIHHFD